MSYRMHPWTQLSLLFCLIVALICCSKPKSSEDTDPPPPSGVSPFKVIKNLSTVSYCGDSFTSDLVIKNGTVIGNVVVGNDKENLYLTYHLEGNWYLTGIQCYAGKKAQLPLTVTGSPNHNQFPGKKDVVACDRVQAMSFKVSLSALETDENGQCATNAQYFIAMRAGVKKINSGENCEGGTTVEAWAAPVLINPGNAEEWATAFYYCKQDCIPWCAYGQGYWFNKPGVVWCQPSVQFGNLVVSKENGSALWPAKNNLLRKAFFQASALQLSMTCNNNGRSLPTSIAGDYATLSNFLSGLSYATIQAGTIPVNTDTTSIKTAAGNIGKWICGNNCNSHDDPTVCE